MQYHNLSFHSNFVSEKRQSFWNILNCIKPQGLSFFFVKKTCFSLRWILFLYSLIYMFYIYVSYKLAKRLDRIGLYFSGNPGGGGEHLIMTVILTCIKIQYTTIVQCKQNNFTKIIIFKVSTKTFCFVAT